MSYVYIENTPAGLGRLGTWSRRSSRGFESGAPISFMSRLVAACCLCRLLAVCRSVSFVPRLDDRVVFI